MQTTLPLLALVASYLGHLHPVGDSLAVFRQYLIILTGGSIFLMIYLERRYLAVFALTVTFMASVPFLLQLVFYSKLDHSDFVIYQKNMSVDLTDQEAFVSDLRTVAPDFATFQEASSKNRRLIDSFEDILPYVHYCDTGRWTGVAIASRWPVIRGTARCQRDVRAAYMRVETPKGPLWLVSIHQKWPWPSVQPYEKEIFLSFLRGLQGDVVVAGDFNMVPWSYTMQEYEQAANASLIAGLRGSFPLTWDVFWIPIDHILLADGFYGSAEMRGFFGSDHRGIVGRFNVRKQTTIAPVKTVPAG
jgi:endonuclease/exonuclease/phosphatase (EEP) superfamily protein YafD